MHIMRSILKHAIVTTGVIGSLGVASEHPQAEKVWEWMKEVGIEAPETAQAAPRPQTQREQIQSLIMEIAPQYGLPTEMVQVIVAWEDEAGEGRLAVRFEDSPDWLKRAQHITKNKDQQDMYRRSYGPMQVAGWQAPLYGRTWLDLTDLRTNIEMGCAILSKAWTAATKVYPKDESKALRAAYRAYNGSGPRAEAYADRAMNSLTARVLNRYVQENGAAPINDRLS